MSAAEGLRPPLAEKRPITRSHHGDDVIDNYEWLRAKDDPAVIAHLEAENAWTTARTGHLEQLRSTLFDEIKARTKETELSVPVREGAWWYYSRTVEGLQYAIHARVAVTDSNDWTPPVIDPAGGPIAGEQILIDDNVEAAGHDFYSLGSFDVSTDGTLLLYGTDVIGDERYTLRFRDLATGKNTEDVIEGTAAGATFAPDGRYVFYPTVDDAWRPDTIWRHTVGSPTTPDVAVFHEPDERYWVGVGLTRSRKFLEIGLSSKITSETLVLDAATPEGEFVPVWPREEGVEYAVDHGVVAGRDVFLIVHNKNAPDFELLEVAIDSPSDSSRWRTVIKHDPATRIEAVDAFATHLTVEYRRDGLSRAGIIRLGSDGYCELEEITFDEPLFAVGIGGDPEWTQPTVRIGFTSFITPSTVFDLNVHDGTRTILKQQAVLGEYDPDEYEQLREWATASDGTRVPLSIVRKKQNSHGPRATVLYGYGSYEASIDPGFSIPRLSLLDRGVQFVIAHVRGGGELGRSWYDEGKLLHKKNSFTDFVASADHLIAQNFTTPGQLVAQGGSAGGLLMGAVLNLAPDRFEGVLAQVPFVDALTSILDPELPLTIIEWDEWGNPLHDEAVYHYMKEYTPYENVRDDVVYPKILAITSLNDTRVLYVEPAKWVARLREVNAPVLLKTEMSAGHGGVSGRYERWKEITFEYAWTLDVLKAHSLI